MHRFHLSTLGLALLFAPALSAQIRASERGSVSQTIDGTVITVDYARPEVRGRKPIFGGFVRWKEIWTPGANYATTIELNRRITVDGQVVEPGKYSMWFRVEPAQWTLILDPHAHLYHTERPDSTPDQHRWIVHPGKGPFTEVLTFAFPAVRPTGGTLQLNWGTTEVALPFMVEPRHPLTISADDAAPYLGAWRFHWTVEGDTTSGMMKITHQNGMLITHWDKSVSPGGDSSVLVRTGKDAFMVGTFEKGEITDIMTEMVLEFTRSGDRAVTFDARDEKDELLGVGKRSER